MKFTVAILLLAAASQAAEQTYRGKQKAKDSLNTAKRELESSGNVEKRAPAISTVAPPTPGIEYADSKESQQDKSPAQQVYATPVPQIAKISDVLTGQGPPFPAAIASHLYSPISVYQPRLGQPTTFQISAPVPSQLAYSEHKISYQPQQNALPVASPAPALKEVIARLPNYQPPYQQPNYQQPILVQPQPLPVYPQQIPQPQPLFQPIPHIVPQNYQQPQYQVFRPVQYVQGPVPQQLQAPRFYLRNQIQLPYFQAPQHLISVPVQIAQQQPGIVYAQDPNQGQQNVQIFQKQQIVQQQQQQQQEQQKQQQEQQQQQQQQLQNIAKEREHQQQQLQKPSVQVQSYSQPQGAVSYASFSQSQPASNYQQKQQSQQSFQPLQYQQPRITLQFRAQPLNTQVKPEVNEKLVALSSQSPRPISYFRPGPTLQLQPVQQQVLPQQQLLVPNPGYAAQHLQASPTFPPVQYFGKHAQSIFGNKYSPQR